MPVNRACYCTRMDVMSSPDIRLTQDDIRHIDSALEASADDVERLTKRRFWNAIETNKWDWPNFQRAYPWRIWFDAKELADVTGTVPTVTTGGQSIPASAIFWGPWNYAPPFTFMELDRSQSYSFGVGSTPQQDVHITGLYGFWAQTRAGGALAAAVSTTTATTLTVTDSSVVGVGDVLTIGSEYLLVRDNAMADTGQTNTSGITTADTSDNLLGVSDGTKIIPGEVLAIDGEWMLAESVTGNTVLVDRAWGGTVLATHSASTAVNALRSLTVQRGFGGSTAAAHSNADAISVALVPGQVRELAIAEALNYVFQKTAGYARTIGENQRIVPGGSLPDLRARVLEAFGRKARQRVI